MGFSDGQHEVIHITGTVVGSISFTCNLLTLMLIYRSNKWGGYILLLLSLTITQMIYDVNYILRVIQTETVCYTTMFLGKLFIFSFLIFYINSWFIFYLSGTYAGLSASFWTNILAFVITYTIIKTKSINIFKHYNLLFFFATILPFIFSLISVVAPGFISTSDNGVNECHYSHNIGGRVYTNVYYWGRFISVIISIILSVINVWRVNQMALSNNYIIKNSSMNNRSSGKKNVGLKSSFNFLLQPLEEIVYGDGSFDQGSLRDSEIFSPSEKSTPTNSFSQSLSNSINHSSNNSSNHSGQLINSMHVSFSQGISYNSQQTNQTVNSSISNSNNGKKNNSSLNIKGGGSSSISSESQQIFTTIKRINYYAFAQIFCRIGSAWNELNYGAYSSYPSAIMAAICSPSAGIWNLCIFLVSI